MPTSYETTLGADAADSAVTAFQISVGGWAYGEITGAADGDFIAVTLVAGQSYGFAVLGVGASGLGDPMLQLFGPDGSTQLASDDNGFANGGAGLTFTAASSGTHYLRVSGVSGASGDYAVAASLGGLAELDATMAAAALFSGDVWQNTALTFGFADATDHGLDNFAQFNEAQRETARAVLQQFAEVTGLSFTEINPGGTTDEATLIYGNYSAADGLAAQSWGPGVTTFGDPSGDVFVNTTAAPEYAALPGSPAYLLLLQHIAHSLGLTAPGTYPAGPLTFALDAAHTHDSQQYSALSQFSAMETGASGLIRDTLGLDDIAALQDIYGANATTRSGATVYGFGADAGAVYDFAQNYDPMLTIWDAAGLDHLDTSQFSAAQLIDLTAGAFSDIGGYVGNVSIAYGTVIENATGGRGADVIIGNTANNSLAGGASDDSLSGGNGHDTVLGGSGGDTLIGGAGNDSLIGDDAGPAPTLPSFDLTTTNGAAGAYVSASGVNLFQSASFTLEFLWQQTSLADPGYVVSLGNLRIYRHADGNASLEFTDAYDEPWLANILPLSLTDGAPHRLSISYNDSDGRLCVYLDGSCTYVHDFTVGTRNLSMTGDVIFEDHAAIGDIRLFDFALSAPDIWATSWTPIADPASIPELMNYWVADGLGGLTNQQIPFPDLTATGSTGSLSTPMIVETSGNRMEGGMGDDSYVVRSSLDLVFEALNAGSDCIYAHIDFALGAGQHVELMHAEDGSGGIHLTGNELGNRLYSSTDAADTLQGGLGNDIYYVYRQDIALVEATGQGTDTAYAYVNYSLGTGVAVEVLRAFGNTGLVLTGNAFANTFYSNAAYGDTLIGGEGNDKYYVFNSADLIVEADAQGNDTIYANVDVSLAPTQSIEVIYAAGPAARTLGGNALANTFYSSTGYGDTLTGGAGNDVFHIYNSAVQVFELAGQGTDTIFANCSYSLGSTTLVEVIHAVGTSGLLLQGNAAANTFHSNAAYGDTLAGGLGNDTYHIRSTADVVQELVYQGTDTLYAYVNFGLAPNLSIEIIHASGTQGLSLSGNNFANVFHSNAGFADTLAGGAGNDVFHIHHSGDLLIEAAGQGLDTLYAYCDYSLAATAVVEILRAAGTGVQIAGNGLANQLYSSAGFADSLSGGAGSDIYHIYHSAAQVFEAANGGTDVLYAYVDFALGAGAQVESLYAAGPVGLSLTGNERANIFYSNAAFADTLSGAMGNDTYYVLNALDQVAELSGGGTDTIYVGLSYSLAADSHVEYLYGTGSAGLWLTGNALQNRIYGTTAADTIEGGIGRDVLTGGSGADVFVFGTLADSALGTNRDLVMDFVSGQDVIDLSLIDADTATAGHQSFAFADTTPTANAVWMTLAGTRLLLWADVTGDGIADTEISLEGISSVGFADLLL